MNLIVLSVLLDYADSKGLPACKRYFIGKSLADDAKFSDAHDHESDCMTCKLGEYTIQDGAIECLKCLPGKKGLLNVTTDVPECVACNPGFYSESEGMTNCSKCNPDEASGFGAKACFQCKPGKFLNTSVFPPSCFPCPVGTYSESGSESCTLCVKWERYAKLDKEYDELSYKLSSGCSLCGVGKYSQKIGGTSSSVCKNCDVGTFSTAVSAKAP